MSFKSIAGILLNLLVLTTAQTTSNDAFLIMNPTDCIAAPVTMSSCASFEDKLDNCFFTTEAAAIASCFCPQSVLNYLAGCHQEWWDCVRQPQVDDLFTGTNGLYYTWSTMCTQLHALSYGPTTPIITTPTVFDQNYCNDAALNCDSLTSSITACDSAYSDDASEHSSCLCNTDMFYYASRCDIDVNEKCLMSTRASSLLFSNQYCAKAVASGTASSTSVRATSSTSEVEPTSTYVPPMPTSTASSGAATTSAAQGSGASGSMKEGYSSSFVFAIAVAVLLG